MKMSTKKMVSAAMLCAVSYILMLLSKLVPQVAGFLQYDAKDVIITIGGFILGPIYAILIITLEWVLVYGINPIAVITDFIGDV